MVKKKTTDLLEELKHKARRYSIKEGIFSSGKGAFGDYYLSPFAIAINSSNALVALLGSFSGLLGPLSQMFSSRLIEKYTRKKIVLKSVLLESLMWLPIIAIAFLFYKGILLNILPILFLIFFSLYVIFMNISGPAWFSWMGDIVTEDYRGRWFSKRNLILGFVAVILTIIASFFLEYFKSKGWIMFGFIILFSLAFIFRMIAWKIFHKKYEPKIKLEKGYYFSFSEFLLNSTKTNFGKFTIFKAIFGFATAISSPLLAIYLLRDLKFSYITYMAIILSGTVFSLFVMELWGKFADRYGNYRVLCISSIFLPLVPILWILNSSPIYLFLVPSIIGGIFWAGFNLASGNFIYDNVTPQKRGIVISYFNMLNGIGIFLGAGLGALLIQFLDTSFIKPLFLIFIISGIVRTIVVIWWLPKIKEIRKTEKFDSSKALKNIIFKEAKPTLLEEAHEIMSMKKYFHKI